MSMYKKHSLSAGRVVDGLAFVVTAEDNKLHTLNQTGTEIWSLAADGVSADLAAKHLASKFEIDLKTAKADAQECLLDFVRSGILELV